MATVTAPNESYLALIREFPLRPIRSEGELVAAIAMIDRLIAREDCDPQEADYLDVLSDLVHRYEAEVDPIPEMKPVDAIRFILRENNLTQSQVAEETGIAIATLSEILNEKRRISPKVRDALARRFRVSPSTFV